MEEIFDMAAIEERLKGGGSAPVPMCVVPRLCSREGARLAADRMRQLPPGGLVIGACAFSARGDAVMGMLAEEGVRDIPVHWADLREGCAFVHPGDAKGATMKAADILAMGLADLGRADGGAPVLRTPPHRRVLILGGGPAGLAAARAALQRGVDVTLVEKRPAIGGMLPMLRKLFPDMGSSSDMLARLDLPAGVDLRTATAVSELRPALGGFTVTLKGVKGDGKPEELSVGAVILAMGGQPVLPKGRLRYGELAGIASQMELETRLAKAERNPDDAASLPRKAVFVQCVAAREDDRPYCSAVCCPAALKNGMRLLECVPDAEVTVLHRNVCMPGRELESFYRLARERGVRMRPMDPEVPLEILEEDGKVSGVRMQDASSGETVTLPCDGLACSTPVAPAPDAAKLAAMLGVRLDDMGFVCGEEPARPLETPVRGVFCCGSVRWPCTVAQAVEEGAAAGLLAATHVAEPSATPSWRPLNVAHATATILDRDCSGCGRCLAACPHGACVPDRGSGPRRTVAVLADRCEGCGGCAAVCPTGAARIAFRPVAGVVEGLRRVLEVA
jgi:heterodisulfide reductase subunit A